MKQGLSLRVSQHLALTPQLQQSIRLLQLSTLELTQEIEQMLDDNPFLEKELEDLAPREDFGLAQENLAATPSDNDNENDTWDAPMERVTEVRGHRQRGARRAVGCSGRGRKLGRRRQCRIFSRRQRMGRRRARA